MYDPMAAGVTTRKRYIREEYQILRKQEEQCQSPIRGTRLHNQAFVSDVPLRGDWHGVLGHAHFFQSEYSQRVILLGIPDIF